VFHVTFPSDWRLGDLQQLFSPFGCVNIAWINDNSAFVGVLKKENVSVGKFGVTVCPSEFTSDPHTQSKGCLKNWAVRVAQW
jgi:hypothetical protein